MVGIFSRFSRSGHRRSQTAIDQGQVLPPNEESVGSDATVSAPRGIEVIAEFKPVEHPIEPLDNDQPVRCPLPEPSILNDGRIWKERLSASVQRTADLPVMKEGAHHEAEAAGTKVQPGPASRSALPSSISAPEHNIIDLLEECKVAEE